jgi:hypothetical protein
MLYTLRLQKAGVNGCNSTAELIGGLSLDDNIYSIPVETVAAIKSAIATHDGAGSGGAELRIDLRMTLLKEQVSCRPALTSAFAKTSDALVYVNSGGFGDVCEILQTFWRAGDFTTIDSRYRPIFIAKVTVGGRLADRLLDVFGIPAEGAEECQ